MTPAAQTRRRKWLFRLNALALPLVLLGIVEVGLRIGGVGYPTDFFLTQRVDGRGVLIENEKFGWRFFPRAMARTPWPVSFPETKSSNTYRIFVLGESAAWGDPEPAFGFARMVEVLLRERYPGTRFEVGNAAMTAINSHAIRVIARDCARRDGDLWLIYMGHNEVVGPFGAGTVFGADTPPLPLIGANLALKSTRVGQLFDAGRQRLAGMESRTQSWGGMQMFLGKQVAADDARLAKVYAHFARNLHDIIETGERAGVKQIVCTVGSNLKDCAPFASKHGDGLSASELTEWEKFFHAGTNAEAGGQFAEATNSFYHAARIDSHFAELHFRMGRCLAALGDNENARRYFAMARDLDTLRFRADTRINEIIRATASGTTAARWRGVQFVDASATLATNSALDIAGEEFFYEHVHLNFEGNYLLARAMVERIAPLLPLAMTNHATQGWLSANDCASRLGWNDWSRQRVLGDMQRRMLDAPFTNQLGHRERSARLERQVEQIAATGFTNVMESAQQFAWAVRRNPDDWALHEKFGEILRESGGTGEAVEQWRHVTRLLPHRAATYNNLGNLFNSTGSSAEAKKQFAEALRRRPDMVEAMNGMGLALASERKFTEAIDFYTRALRAKPDFVAARVNLGLVLTAQGNTAGAMKEYEEALRWKPDSGMAHANLATLLAAQGKSAEALTHFSEAARLMPKNAAAHFNLGNALVSGNEAAAADEYAAAVRLDPKFAAARVSLGTILVRHGQFSEGAAQLNEALRLNPNLAPGHLALGVALEQQGRLAEAATHYREALRIDPANAAAKKRIDSAAARLPRGGR